MNEGEVDEELANGARGVVMKDILFSWKVAVDDFMMTVCTRRALGRLERGCKKMFGNALT
jgi:hypothetical protein